MGLFSDIGSFFGTVISGVGRAIVSGVSKAVSVIRETVVTVLSSEIGRSIGSAIGKAIGTLVAGPLGPVVGMTVGTLINSFIASVVRKLGASEKVIDEKEKPEEVGARLEEAAKHPDWKQREAFNEYSEYYDYLKVQIPDEQIDAQSLETDRNKYLIIYTSAITAELCKKMGIEVTDDLLIAVGRARMDMEEMKQYIMAFKAAGLKETSMKDFFMGKLTAEVHSRIIDALVNIKQSANKNLSKLDIRRRNYEIQEAFRDDEKVYKNYQKETDSVIQEIETNKKYDKNFGYGKEFDDKMADAFNNVQG